MTEKNQEKGSKGTPGQGQCHHRKPWHNRKQHQRSDYKKKVKDPKEIPILKYGPANNFTKFKEAISKTALKDNGQLGKLIKLYALILQYLSEESLEEIKRSDKFEKIDEATDPLGLWLLVEETHKVNTIMTGLAARTTYQTMRQGPFESIITYKERFNFKGLDDNLYATFKTDLTNQLTLKAIKQPENLNAMYLLAHQWLTTKTKVNPTETATTFTTTCDRQDQRKSHRNNKNKRDKKPNGKSEKQEKANSDEK